MSYENCPFDDVDIVMMKGQPGDVVRPSDPEFQQMVIDYISENPNILNSPALQTAISNYIASTQTLYTNYELGQDFAVCQSITQVEGENVVHLSEYYIYGFRPKTGGILSIEFPNGIPAGILKIRFVGTYFYVYQTIADGGYYDFKGFEVSPGDIVTFMCYDDSYNNGKFVILGTNRPSAAVMEDGRIWNKYLPKPESLFMTTEGRTHFSYPEYSDQLRTIVITGTGPTGVKSYPLFIDITGEGHAPSAIDSSIRGYGITSRSEGVDGVGSFSAEVKVKIPTIAPVSGVVDWKVLWYIYG